MRPGGTTITRAQTFSSFITMHLTSRVQQYINTGATAWNGGTEEGNGGAMRRRLRVQSAEYMIIPPPGMVSLRLFAGWDVVQSDAVTSREITSDGESTGSDPVHPLNWG